LIDEDKEDKVEWLSFGGLSSLQIDLVTLLTTDN